MVTTPIPGETFPLQTSFIFGRFDAIHREHGKDYRRRASDRYPISSQPSENPAQPGEPPYALNYGVLGWGRCWGRGGGYGKRQVPAKRTGRKEADSKGAGKVSQSPRGLQSLDAHARAKLVKLAFDRCLLQVLLLCVDRAAELHEDAAGTNEYSFAANCARHCTPNRNATSEMVNRIRASAYHERLNISRSPRTDEPAKAMASIRSHRKRT